MGETKQDFEERITSNTLTSKLIYLFGRKIPERYRLACMVPTSFVQIDGKTVEHMEYSQCRIVKKYPYIAVTTKGVFSWAELAYWNLYLVKQILSLKGEANDTLRIN